MRTAQPDETLRTLDGQMRTLTPEMLVIADAERPVAIAGVMGGAESEVSGDTHNIVLESAHFAPLSVRRTSKASVSRQRPASVSSAAPIRDCRSRPWSVPVPCSSSPAPARRGARSWTGYPLRREPVDPAAASRTRGGAARCIDSRPGRPPDPREPGLRRARRGERVGTSPYPRDELTSSARWISSRKSRQALRLRSHSRDLPRADGGTAADRSAHHPDARAAVDHDRRGILRSGHLRLRRRVSGNAVCGRRGSRSDCQPVVGDLRRAATVDPAGTRRSRRAQPAPRAARRAAVRNRRAILTRARRATGAGLRVDRCGRRRPLERRHSRRRLLRHAGRRRARVPGVATWTCRWSRCSSHGSCPGAARRSWRPAPGLAHSASSASSIVEQHDVSASEAIFVAELDLDERVSCGERSAGRAAAAPPLGDARHLDSRRRHAARPPPCAAPFASTHRRSSRA